MKRLLAFALALGLCTIGCKKTQKTKDEIVRRQAYARELAVDAGGGSSIAVGGSNEVHFEEGFGLIQLDPANDYRGHAVRYMGQKGHLRVLSQNDRPMHLKVGGWVDEKVIKTKPRVTVYLDGQVVAVTGLLDDSGVFKIDTLLPPDATRGRGWVDLDIVVSAVAFHWGDPPDLKVALLFEFAWYD